LLNQAMLNNVVFIQDKFLLGRYDLNNQ